MKSSFVQLNMLSEFQGHGKSLQINQVLRVLFDVGHPNKCHKIFSVVTFHNTDHVMYGAVQPVGQ